MVPSSNLGNETEYPAQQVWRQEATDSGMSHKKPVYNRFLKYVLFGLL